MEFEVEALDYHFCTCRTMDVSDQQAELYSSAYSSYMAIAYHNNGLRSDRCTHAPRPATFSRQEHYVACDASKLPDEVRLRDESGYPIFITVHVLSTVVPFVRLDMYNCLGSFGTLPTFTLCNLMTDF